jgi:tetratricopeptide (TPR) repeat protein
MGDVKNLQAMMDAANRASADGQVLKALALSKQAVQSHPDNPRAHHLFGQLNQRDGRLAVARRHLERACDLEPDDPVLLRGLANALEQLEAWPDLRSLIGDAIDRWPQDDRWLMDRARINTYLGDFENAAADFRRVLGQTPGHADALFSLAMRGDTESTGGLAGIEARLEDDDLQAMQRIRLRYARASLLEREGRLDEAFGAYREANRERAARGGMDLAAKKRGAIAVLNDMTPEIIERYSGRGNRSERPVFIVGMPRSGTTLVEQVLAAHPDVYAAGEHQTLGSILKGLVSEAPRRAGSVIEAIDSLGPEVWRQAGAEYLRRIREIDPDRIRFTDKLPANFAVLPYVKLIFPAARILHIRRDPLATLSSCIRQPFSDPLLAFTVEDWAGFYGLYQALMEHWRPVLGQQVLDIEYEELVRDFPVQARRLVEFTGLEWNAACLHPEQARRAVRTASLEQVRRGVYTGSVDAWRSYEKHLLPLRPLIEESRAEVVSAVAGKRGDQ